MRRTRVRWLPLTCALLSITAAACGGGEVFTDAGPGPDSADVDAATVDADVDAAEPDADVTEPDTELTLAPDDPDNDATPSFEFESDEAGATFECRIDNGTFTACTSPFTALSQSDGEHTFEVRAVDGSGNIDATPAAHTWTVDTDPPETTIDDAPPAVDNSPDVTFEFSADEAGATFECNLDAAGFAPCTSPHDILDLADGNHTFAVRAIDPAGNVDTTPDTHDWSLDATTPNTVIDSGPPDPDNQTSATFTFSSPNVGVGGTFDCSIDGGAFTTCTSPHTVTGLTEDDHVFAVRVTDLAGNPDPSPADHEWKVDLTTPETTITLGPQDPTNQTAATFHFTSEPNATFECSLDGGAFTPCTSPHTTSGTLADGPHAFAVRAVDVAGNEDPTPASRAWTVDTVAPNTTITSAPPPLTNQIAASFQFTSTEPGSTFSCRLDAGAFVPCASPASYPGLAPGSHTVQIRATDPAGNTDASPAQHTWMIDTAPPDTTITSGPPAVTASTSASFMFTATEAGSTFECRLDGAAFAACTSPQAYTGLPGGTHTFEVRAIDPAGNVDPGTAQRTWVIDLTPPDTSIVMAPNSPTIDTSATFTFASTETGSTFECRLDAAAFAPCTTPTMFTGLAAGNHTFQVRATDSVGNVDPTPASRAWTIDGTPPDTTINLNPPAVTNQTTALFGFVSSESGSTYECAIDGGAFVACTSPRTVSGLAAGSHTFQVRARDPVGNLDPTPASYTWTIDTTAPNTTITSAPSNPTAATSASFMFTATEGGSTFECRLDGQAFGACTSPRSYVGLGAGSHTFEVRAIDPAGNTDATPATHTWVIDLSPPDTTITAAPANPTSATGATFQFTSSEAGSTFECRLDAAAFAACTTPHVIAGPLAAGSHTFHVRAIDPAGGVDPTPASHTWVIDATAPNTTITSAPPTPTASTTADFTFTSSETGSTFECSLDGGAFVACTSPRQYTGLPAVAHTFAVRAIDPAGNTDATPATHAWTIDQTPPNTTITSGPSTPTSQTAASFTFTSTEGGSTFQCRVDGGAFTTCSSPQSYTGLAAGAHVFDVRATDAAGNTDASPATHAWTIDLTPPDTTLGTVPANPTNQTGASFTLTSEAGATFECRLDGVPFAACTSPHALAGLAAGSHTFEARATDIAGNTDPSPASHTWVIDLTPPDTAIDTGPSGTVSSASATFTFSSEAGAVFQCSLDGAVFASCSSGITYNSLAQGAHTFLVRAIDTAGNVDATPASRSWTVDTSAPDTTITVSPPNPTNQTAATFEFTSTEPGTFECRLDGGAFTACTTPHTIAGPLSQASHTFEVRAIDAGANADPTPASHTWVVDTTAPNTNITGQPANPTGLTSATFTFSSPDGGTTFQCQLDGGGFSACTSPQVYNGPLAGGSHTFQVRSTDAAGNTDASPASYTWTIDQDPPLTTVTSTPPADPTNVNDLTITFDSDEAGSTFECSLNGAAFTACATPLTFTDLPDGAYTFTVHAIDPQFNVGNDAGFGWTIDTVAPDTTITSDPQDPGSASATFSFDGTETFVFECQLDGGGFSTCTSPVTYNSLVDGSHTFEVRAWDEAGNTDPTPASETWTVDTTAPQTTITSGAPSPTSANGSITFTSSEAGSTFVCVLDGVPGACTSPFTYTGLADGGHTFTVAATDPAGNTDATPASVAWAINVPDLVIIFDALPTDGTTDTNAHFEFHANDPSATFTCRIGPPFDGTNPMLPCSSPYDQAGLSVGLHGFEIHAETAGDTADASYFWTINSAAAAVAPWWIDWIQPFTRSVTIRR